MLFDQGKTISHKFVWPISFLSRGANKEIVFQYFNSLIIIFGLRHFAFPPQLDSFAQFVDDLISLNVTNKNTNITQFRSLSYKRNLVLKKAQISPNMMVNILNVD